MARDKARQVVFVLINTDAPLPPVPSKDTHQRSINRGDRGLE